MTTNLQSSTALLELARRLLTHEAEKIQETRKCDEAEKRQDREVVIEATERVLDKLRLQLSKRIGQEGFRTLLARALILTTAKFPQLGAIRVGTEGSLIGFPTRAEPHSEAAPAHGQIPTDRQIPGHVTQEDFLKDFIEASTALVSQLLNLLATFIGEDLTLRIFRAV